VSKGFTVLEYYQYNKYWITGALAEAHTGHTYSSVLLTIDLGWETAYLTLLSWRRERTEKSSAKKVMGQFI